MMKPVKKIRFTPVCVSIMVWSLMVASISYAKIDFKNCVGMWLFDEDKGDVAKDSSEKGNDGIIVGKAKRVNGKFGSALKFDGVATSVNIELDVMDLNKDQTFSVWFKTKIDKNIHARVLHAPFLNSYRLWLWIMRNGHGKRGQLGFGYRAGDIGLEITSGQPLNDDNWHHAVAILDHTTKQGLLYIDGKLNAQSSIAGIKFNDSLGKLCIVSACTRDFLPGQIDDVAIFNVTLKEEDIKSIMNEGLKKALDAAAVSPTGKLTTIWAATKAQ